MHLKNNVVILRIRDSVGIGRKKFEILLERAQAARNVVLTIIAIYDDSEEESLFYSFSFPRVPRG